MSRRSTRPSPEIITEDRRLTALCRQIRTCGWFGFDTEFVGEDQFRPEVCLIQIVDDEGIFLVDPLAGISVSPIWELVADTSVLKIVHAGAEDLAQTWYAIDKPPANVIDLQIAAGLVGPDYPISLSRLVRLQLGDKLHKSQTLSDWRQRPLHADQIGYAAEDVAYLRPVYDKLIAKLTGRGRLDWLAAECAAMCAATRPAEDPVQRLKKLKGAGALSPRELSVAYAILDEREKLAGEYNRPLRAVIRDHIVVELARRGWTEIDQLRSLRGMSLAKPALVRVAAAIGAAKNLPKESWPELPNKEDAPDEDILIDILAAVVKDWCLRNDVSYGLMCKKQWLRDFVRLHTRSAAEAAEVPLLQGWRGACVGDMITRVITGRAAIQFESRGADTRIRVTDAG